MVPRLWKDYSLWGAHLPERPLAQGEKEGSEIYCVQLMAYQNQSPLTVLMAVPKAIDVYVILFVVGKQPKGGIAPPPLQPNKRGYRGKVARDRCPGVPQPAPFHL